MIDRLRVVGPVRGTSGYDRHTREFVRHFIKLGVAVELRHVEGWSVELPPSQRESWVDRLGAPVGATTALHFVMPPRAAPVPGMRNVNYTMFEADRIPPAWAARAADHDLIVVPTAASREAWLAGGVDERRVVVAPLGVDADFFSRPVAPLPLMTASGRWAMAYSTRFLSVAELRPRKNLLGLLRVWIRATRPDDDAVLILKASAFRPHVVPQFLADVDAMQVALGRRLIDAAPVVLLAELLPDPYMPALYRTATHYVSVSHGEGWDLPMMEAATAGLQLIAPRHTAYVEYLRDDEVEFIPARPARARFEGRVGAEDAAFFERSSWWDPDEHAATDAIRRAIDGLATPKSSPAARIADEYCWERSACRLLDAMGGAAA
jgi:glycosyltransferase involved in cell wall biosynthesis